MNDSHRYDDIIGLPHHVSQVHPRMPMAERAAQFSPFAALTGYGDVVAETARLTEEKPELSESRKAELDAAIRALQGKSNEVNITYFLPDAFKSGGAIITEKVHIRTIDPIKKVLTTVDRREIRIDDVVDISEME